MTTPELELRLTNLLQERAEDAMERTKTQEKLSSLLADGRLDGQRRRRRVAAGGLAAAAVAATVAVAAWLASGGEKETAPEPAPAPNDELAAAVATVFIENTYAFELDGVIGMMSDDVVIDDAATLDAWLADYRWREAAGFSLTYVDCREGGATSEGTEATCTFAFHALGSDRLGMVPFGSSTFDVAVRDGEITRIDETLEFMDNGFSEHVWEPFAAWVADRHPADVEVMYADADQSGASFAPRSLRLWEQRISEWVAFEQQG